MVRAALHPQVESSELAAERMAATVPAYAFVLAAANYVFAGAGAKVQPQGRHAAV